MYSNTHRLQYHTNEHLHRGRNCPPEVLLVPRTPRLGTSVTTALLPSHSLWLPMGLHSAAPPINHQPPTTPTTYPHWLLPTTPQ